MKNIDFNKIYDLIVIGGNDAGSLCVKDFLKKQPEYLSSMAWVSSDFSNTAKKLIEENDLACLVSTVAYINYFRGLTVLEFIDSNSRLFCKNLILAVGSKPKAILPEVRDVTINYSAKKLLNKNVLTNKKDSLLIIGNITKALIDTSVKFTKLYNKVIILTPEFNYNTTEAMANKIKNAGRKLQIIPGSELRKYSKVINKIKCELSTYTELLVDDVLMETDRIPDLAQFNSPLFVLDQNNLPEITDKYESTKISTVYIINEPDSDSNIKNIIAAITDTILSKEIK